ncbi:MAG: DUF4394 domain-containing protein, partial [Chloroflexales bacterium]|nr:DUF4394 domain-containing protein [Chloroflexales bacterium]
MQRIRGDWWKQFAQGGAVLAVALAALTSLAPVALAASDPTVAGLTTANELVQFNDARPDRILARATISGLASGETLLGIDVRPATGQLFGVSSASQLYTIDSASGAATKVGTPFVLPLNFDSAVGIDFNPTVDRLRVVTDKGQNLRVNPNTGAVVDADLNTAGVQPDGNLAYASTDRNAGRTPNVVAAAYTNNTVGATTTTLYDIDSDRDILVIQNLPNAGTLNTVGELRVNATDRVGFDIFTDEDGDNARAAISKGSEPSKYYTIDLTSGRAKV